ncbi:hypothetical protein LJB42_004862 [Komagataella kurtzmanii]|nr:hypothetical protein LJB42_004862 [Komagataella kurtzmanii]
MEQLIPFILFAVISQWFDDSHYSAYAAVNYPPEIWTQILNQLNQKDVIALMLTNRITCSLSATRLYRRVYITAEDSQMPSTSYDEWNYTVTTATRFLKMLRTSHGSKLAVETVYVGCKLNPVILFELASHLPHAAVVCMDMAYVILPHHSWGSSFWIIGNAITNNIAQLRLEELAVDDSIPFYGLQRGRALHLPSLKKLSVKATHWSKTLPLVTDLFSAMHPFQLESLEVGDPLVFCEVCSSLGTSEQFRLKSLTLDFGSSSDIPPDYDYTRLLEIMGNCIQEVNELRLRFWTFQETNGISEFLRKIAVLLGPNLQSLGIFFLGETPRPIEDQDSIQLVTTKLYPSYLPDIVGFFAAIQHLRLEKITLSVSHQIGLDEMTANVSNSRFSILSAALLLSVVRLNVFGNLCGPFFNGWVRRYDIGHGRIFRIAPRHNVLGGALPPIQDDHIQSLPDLEMAQLVSQRQFICAARGQVSVPFTTANKDAPLLRERYRLLIEDHAGPLPADIHINGLPV